MKPVIDADPKLGRLHPERSGVLSLRGWVDRVSPPGLGVEEAILGSEGPSWWPYGPMLQKLWRRARHVRVLEGQVPTRCGDLQGQEGGSTKTPHKRVNFKVFPGTYEDEGGGTKGRVRSMVG